jgi:hypothetical protein
MALAEYQYLSAIFHCGTPLASHEEHFMAPFSGA